MLGSVCSRNVCSSVTTTTIMIVRHSCHPQNFPCATTLATIDLVAIAFSRMVCKWSPTVCSLLGLASITHQSC